MKCFFSFHRAPADDTSIVARNAGETSLKAAGIIAISIIIIFDKRLPHAADAEYRNTEQAFNLPLRGMSGESNITLLRQREFQDRLPLGTKGEMNT